MLKTQSYGNHLKQAENKDDLSKKPSNWRSSLRSTRKDAKPDQGESRSSYRSNVVRENLTKFSKSGTADQKCSTMTSSSRTERKSDCKSKVEIAAKAKDKFLANLSRFQKETKATNSNTSPFQRSFRRDNAATAQGSSMSNDFRRSHRVPPTSRPPADSNAHLRQSLRKERITDSIARFEKSSSRYSGKKEGIKEEENAASLTTSTFRDKKSSDRPSRDKQTSSDSGSTDHHIGKGYLSSTTSSRTTSTSSITADGEPASTSNRPRKQSRAEIAMERHMDRMRKASQSAPANPVSLSQRQQARPKPRNVEGDSGITSSKQITKEKYEPEVPPEGVYSMDNDDVDWLTFDFMEYSPLKSVIDFLSSDTPIQNAPKQPEVCDHSATAKPWESVNVVEDNVLTPSLSSQPQDVTENKNTFDSLDLRSPVITRKTASKASHRRTRRNESKLAAKQPSSADQVKVNGDSPISRKSTEQSITTSVTPTSYPSYKASELALSPTSDERIKEKKNFFFSEPIDVVPERVHYPSATPSTEPVAKQRSSPIKYNKIRSSPATVAQVSHPLESGGSREKSAILEPAFSSKEPSFSKKKFGDKPIALDSNFSAEEAIDTFRRLSEEIDTIKSRTFRQTVAERNLNVENTGFVSPRRETGTVQTSTDIIPEDPIILSLPETGSLLQPATLLSSEHKPDNSNIAGSHYSVGSTSQSGAVCNRREKRKKVSEIERENISKEAGLHSTAVNSVDDLHSEKPEVPTFDKLKLQKEENFHSDSEFKERQVNQTTKYKPDINDSVAPESLVLTVENLPAPKTILHNQTPSNEESEMSVSTQPQPVNKLSQLSAAERRARLRKAVLKYRKEVSSDSDSLFSDCSDDGSDIDMAWLEEGDTDASFSDLPKSSPNKTKNDVKVKVTTESPQKEEPRVNGYNSIDSAPHAATNGVNSDFSANDVNSKSGAPNIEVTNDAPSEEETEAKPKLSNMKSLWEAKAVQNKKPVRSSSSVQDLEGIRNKVGSIKSVWGAKSPNTTPVRERRQISHDNDDADSVDSSSDNQGSDSRKVGSMLSIWENKKAKQQSGFDASKDEAFDSSTMGRLNSAKALFRNMSKKGTSDTAEPRSRSGQNGSVSPKIGSTSISRTKSMFERKSPWKSPSVDSSSSSSIGREEPSLLSPKQTSTEDSLPSEKNIASEESSPSLPKQMPLKDSSSEEKPLEPSEITCAASSKSSPRSRTVSDDWLYDSQDDVSNELSLSSTSSSDNEIADDEAEAEQETLRERKRSHKSSVSSTEAIKSSVKETIQYPEEEGEDAKTPEDNSNVSLEDESEKILPSEMEISQVELASLKKYSTSSKSTAGRSNIQKKFAARKKRGRRSMTQPITGDDVTTAQKLVQEQTTSSVCQDKEGEEESSNGEEKTVPFADRLSFFNQLCAKNTPAPTEKQLRPRPRTSLRRYLTQPVDREVVERAQNQLKAKRTDEVKRPLSDEATDRVSTVSRKQEILPSTASVKTLSTRLSGRDLLKENSSIGSDFTSDEDSLSDNKTKPEPARKVGKLSPALKKKFLETDKSVRSFEVPKSQSKTHRRFSSEKSDPSSFHKPNQISPRIQERSRSPLLARYSPSIEGSGDSTGEEPEMGKTRDSEIKATGSIHDRLKLLEKNKEEAWKKKVKNESKSVQSSLGDRMNKLQENEEKWKKNKQETSKVRKTSESGNKANISDRLNSILANSEKWKSKSGKQNDASQFTVQAKIAKREGQKMAPVIPSPSMKRKGIPLPVKEEPVVTIDDVTSNAPSLNKLSEVLKLSQKGLEPEVIKTTEESTTEIPHFDDEDFENFFGTSHTEDEFHSKSSLTNGGLLVGTEEPVLHETPKWLETDTDNLTANSRLSDIGRLKASVQRHTTRNKRSSRNPVKALAARTDVKQSYTEHRSNVTKLEQQRLASKLGFGSNFTSAALAGLAAKADFSKVNLRSTKGNSAFSASDHKPWKKKMLLRVKGRRHVQTRLVEPVCGSLNSGDAFLLILPDRLYAWFGEYSNVIEKAKVQEIADYIIHQGDLGSTATSLTTITEDQSSYHTNDVFWEHLGGRTEFAPSGGVEEDEDYEANAELTIKSYKLEDSKLIPHKDSWGKLPTMGQLSSTNTYVFDFGAEMYVWHGKEVSFEDRQLAIKLARTLWDQGYDYTEVGFCPFLPFDISTTHLKGSRPEWGLFARVNENLETALVQEKFEDWSNISREIGDREEVLKETSRGHIASEMKVKSNIVPDMVAYDVTKMKKDHIDPSPLHLEGYNLWRGHGHIFDDDGRGLNVHTSNVEVWHATDKSLELMEEKDKGVFHRGGTYVVRWRYVISSTGKWNADKPNASGDLNKDPKGRERVAFFLWTGRESTVNDKGASALMATELDKEVGSQVVVTEEKAPPAMVQCFNGRMVVIDGKKGVRGGFYSWKLFSVRGCCKEEASLHQVPCNVASLRSRSSFVCLHGRYAKIIVWHGAKSPAYTRKAALHAAKLIADEMNPCFGFRSSCKSVDVQECEEGSESSDFLDGVGTMRRHKYLSLLDTKSSESLSSARAWHLLPSNNVFVAKALTPTSIITENNNKSDTCYFPYVQEQIKDLVKPAFVLLENSEGVYLWQGCAAEESTGSSKRHQDICRRLAMETTLAYCKEYRANCSATLINEDHEPVEFTNSFPMWRECERKISFDEKRAKKPKPVADVLSKLSRLTYTLDELRASPLPEGVDPNHLETYLTISDFVDLFEMSKEEFYNLPPWKQQNLRKEKNLF